jgi:Transketolase, thiamine diphosphate binding domain
LGFGLPVGVGVALAAKTVDPHPYRVWVLVGDSEMAEGSVWEAFEHASYRRLDNLTVIVDVNRLGQSGETMHGWDAESYADRARSFGWNALVINGHDLDSIDEAYAEASATRSRPAVIVARTRKGKGVAAVEHQPGWARQGSRRSRGGDCRARWPARYSDRGGVATGRPAAAKLRRRPADAPGVRGRNSDGDATRLRRSARRTRSRPRGHRRHGWRSLELDLLRPLRRSPS